LERVCGRCSPQPTQTFVRTPPDPFSLSMHATPHTRAVYIDTMTTNAEIPQSPTTRPNKLGMTTFGQSSHAQCRHIPCQMPNGMSHLQCTFMSGPVRALPLPFPWLSLSLSLSTPPPKSCHASRICILIPASLHNPYTTLSFLLHCSLSQRLIYLSSSTFKSTHPRCAP